MACPIVPQFTVRFTKQIEPVWHTDGRRRLIGFHALLNNDLLLVPGSQTIPHLFDCYCDADVALDEAALDLIDEAATTADMEALPFEPTACEIAEMRATSGQVDPWLHLWASGG